MGYDFTITEIIRGGEAMQRALAENQFNDPPNEGWEYIFIYAVVDYNEGDDVFEFSDREMSIVTDGRLIDYFGNNAFVAGLEPKFDLSLLPGGSGGGWLVFEIVKDDPAPILAIGGSDGVFFDVSASPGE